MISLIAASHTKKFSLFFCEMEESLNHCDPILTRISNIFDTRHYEKNCIVVKSNLLDPPALAFIGIRFSFSCLWKTKDGENDQDAEQGCSLDHWLSKSNKSVSFVSWLEMHFCFPYIVKGPVYLPWQVTSRPTVKSRFLKILAQFLS